MSVENKDIQEVPEKDKPFYLAVFSMAAMLASIIYTIYLSSVNANVSVDLWKDIALFFSPFVMGTWAWYFKGKSD